MFKKWGLSAAALLVATAVILPGCASKQEPPKEALKNAAAKAVTLSSYELNTKFVVNDLTIDAPTDDPSSAMATQVLSMLKNAEISVDSVYQADPMQTEATLVLNLKGDMAMSFTIPIVATKEKVYIKVPSIPFFPIPENIVGKFVELDLKELAEKSGQEFNAATLDTEKARKLQSEVLDAVLAQYDESKYFKDIKPKDAGLPEGVDAKQVIQFGLNNDNIKEAITIFINNALPKLFDVISKDEYKDLLQVDPADLAKAKEEILAGKNKAEIDKDLADLEKYLTINQFQFNTAINKDDFPVYQNLLMDFKVNIPEDNTNIGLSVTGSNQYSKINEKADFKIGIPQGDAVVTLDELQKQFGGSSDTF
ncbi:hypothetical protein [Paenibacillus sp. GCM10012306]|uniref:hypothetical protein n=1 Tax=Paenibacillus sp. GCM10012306 TaxID=3317342 RepID=UPI00361D28F2